MKIFTSLKLKFVTLFLTSLLAFPVMAQETVCPPKANFTLNIPHEKFFSPTPNYDTVLLLKKSERPEEFQKAFDKFVEKFGPAPFEIDTFIVVASKDRKHMALVYEAAGCVKNTVKFNEASQAFFFGQDV